jgi:hypothetical protein
MLILILATWLAPHFNLVAALVSPFCCNLAELLVLWYVFPNSRHHAH